MNKNASIAIAVLLGMLLVDLVIGPLTVGLFKPPTPPPPPGTEPD